MVSGNEYDFKSWQKMRCYKLKNRCKKLWNEACDECEQELGHKRCVKLLKPQREMCEKEKNHNFDIWVSVACDEDMKRAFNKCEKKILPNKCRTLLEPEEVKCKERKKYDSKIWDNKEASAADSATRKRCIEGKQKAIEELNSKHPSNKELEYFINLEFEKCQEEKDHNFDTWKDHVFNIPDDRTSDPPCTIQRLKTIKKLAELIPRIFSSKRIRKKYKKDCLQLEARLSAINNILDNSNFISDLKKPCKLKKTLKSNIEKYQEQIKLANDQRCVIEINATSKPPADGIKHPKSFFRHRKLDENFAKTNRNGQKIVDLKRKLDVFKKTLDKNIEECD